MIRPLPPLPRGLAEVVVQGAETLRPYGEAAGPYRIPPLAVARPRDPEEVAVLLRWARDQGVPVVPRGAGTGMPAGNVGPGLILDLRPHFSGIDPPDVRGRRIRAGAGAVLARVDRAASGVGLRLPPLPSSSERATVGGVVANNSAGAASFRFGAMREWTVELDVALADGSLHRIGSGRPVPDAFREAHRALRPGADRILDRWPDVRKNSSGYLLDAFLPTGDPVHLVTGSEGTLAVVLAATFRLAPRPAASGVLLLPLSDPDAIPGKAGEALSAGATACEFLGRRFLEMAGPDALPGGISTDGVEAVLLVEAEGEDERGVRSVLEVLAGSPAPPGATVATEADERERIWAVRHAASPVIARKAASGLRSTQVIEDSVVPPSRLPEYVRGIDGILADVEMEAVVFGHAGDGNVHVNPLVPVGRPGWRDDVRRVLRRTVTLVADLGGTLAGEHGDGRLRAPFLERIWGTGTVSAFREVKRALDPDGILNPGVILPLTGQDPLEGLWVGGVEGAPGVSGPGLAPDTP